jgi:polyphosphate kinase 2
MSKSEQEEELYRLRVELVKLQRWVIEKGERLLVVLEGRDAAGKDGAIKTVTKHMSPRETRVFAPSKPSDKEQGSWYFQRFVPHLPSDGEIVFFNRSWYNRAGVEQVMGFATSRQVERFLDQAPVFEKLITDSGTRLLKLYVDVSRDEQAERLEDRVVNPLKAWKLSPIDQVAGLKFDEYTKARDEMLARTHTQHAPWTIVCGDHKKKARLEILRFLIASADYPKRDADLLEHDGSVLFTYDRTRRDELKR